MEEQEVKIETPVEEESDFADEVKPVEVPEPEAKKEEEAPKKEENAINLRKEEEDITPEPEPVPEEKPVEGLKSDEPKGKKGKAVVTYEYSDPLLEEIEKERVNFFKEYKKFNLIKWIVTGVCLILIILGWILPTFVPFIRDAADGKASIFVTLGTIVVAIALLAVFSFLFKKKTDKMTAEYFKKYYDCNDAYVFGEEISEKQGDVNSKLADSLFNDAGLYKDVFKVGSRNCITFKKGEKLYTFADAAAQVRGQKVLQTVFVGKYLVTSNEWTGGDLIVYFKGNDRALPPTTLDSYEVLDDKKDLVLYGNSNAKKLLTKEVKDAIKEIRTNKTLVDLSIAVRAGRTFVAMGYEDNLMILPMDKPFNPAPTEQHKEDMAKVFALLDAFDGAMNR